jgi:acyl-CoA reductase-like NAD-dependent aldehyde dehydrogenase
MFKLVQLIEQHKEILATIETWDNGKFMSMNALNQSAYHVMQASPTQSR